LGHDSSIQEVLERIISGKKGRPRKKFIPQICGKLGLKYLDIKGKL